MSIEGKTIATIISQTKGARGVIPITITEIQTPGERNGK